MKEKLYTIPLNDAVQADTECPFCYIERSVEQDLLDFVLGSGSSYMESDVRSDTDKEGFCRMHFQKMFDYGNTLGNGWILKTHYERLQKEMKEQFAHFKPQKSSLLEKFKKGGADTLRKNAIGIWAKNRDASCYICNRFADTYARYLDTFFYLYEKDEVFRQKIQDSKGFCLTHFGDLCEAAENALPDAKKDAFYTAMFSLMEKSMARMTEDISWLIEKFDYRNREADWKTSKDAIQRGMQKLKGGFPADSPYKQNK